MTNGQMSDFPTGRLSRLTEYNLSKLINRLLVNADTVTASPELLSEERCENDELDLSNRGLVTVNDIKEQPWFVKVTVVNLSYNKIKKIPVPFFKLFPNAQKYIFTGNPITHLDTTYMPHGLKVVAEYTALELISSTTLHKNGYIFSIAHTPLTCDWQKLVAYCYKCNPRQESLVLQMFNRCCGKHDDTEDDIGSRIETVATSY